jgi:hypothetical protein
MTGDAKAILLLVLLVLTACADEGPRFNHVSAGLPPPPTNRARIFVYRDFAIYQGLEWVPIFFNGTTIGAVGPGHVILRDVAAPGTYRIEPKSEGLWPDQAKTVTVAPGQVIYAKVTSFKGLDPSAGDSAELITYVVVLMDPATGRREIDPLWYEAQSSNAQAHEQGRSLQCMASGPHSATGRRSTQITPERSLKWR